MIAIVDYGSGNVAAIADIFKRLKLPHAITRDHAELRVAERYILPGVGAFDTTMRTLRESGLKAGDALCILLPPGEGLFVTLFAAEADPYGGFKMGLQSYTLRAFDARTALEAAITAAIDGGRTARAIRNTRQAELKLLLDQLSGYVSSRAEGNELAILSSGFEVRRTGKPLPEPLPPANVRAELTMHPGRVALNWERTRGAVTFQDRKSVV